VYWLDALNRCVEQGQAYVLVTITQVDGSAPRGVGSRMLVTPNSEADSIGGGALEHRAVQQAREVLANQAPAASIVSDTYVLGKALSQCCGGRVTLQFDYQPACAINIVVFGAGHVAQALATILHQLPCRAHFYDARQAWLDRLPLTAPGAGVLHANRLGDNPFDTVEHCSANAYYLVMTHSHELDYDLVEAQQLLWPNRVQIQGAAIPHPAKAQAIHSYGNRRPNSANRRAGENRKPTNGSGSRCGGSQMSLRQHNRVTISIAMCSPTTDSNSA